MLPPARAAEQSEIEFLEVDRPFSNFQWLASKFWDVPTLQRLLSQIRVHDAKTMTVEKLRPQAASDLQEEDDDLHKRLTRRVQSTAYRLSFFRTLVKSEDALKDVPPGSALGYAIIKHDDHEFGRDRVFESVIQSNEYPNNYVRGKKTWKYLVAGQEFQTSGYVYAQQNGVTNCCAHVALMTAIGRFFPEGSMSFRQMNEIFGIDHVHNRLGPGGNCLGVSLDQMVKVLEFVGARCDVADYQKRRKFPLPPYQKYVYSSIESGYPALIIFGNDELGHTIPVFGHTFNQDIWVPNAEQFYFAKQGATGRYTPSDSWLSSFICHDDNVGSNLCIPRHYLRVPTAKATKHRSNLGADYVASVIGTLPAQVKVNAIRAEAIAFDYLGAILPAVPAENNVWMEHVRNAFATGRLILRTIMCDSTQYADHLNKVSGWEFSRIEDFIVAAIRQWKPRTYWLVEISIPELFSANRRKVGEIILEAESFSSQPRDFENFILARLPGFYVLSGGYKKDQKVKFNSFSCAVKSHTELFGSEQSAPDQTMSLKAA